MLAFNHRSKQTLSRVCPLLLCPPDPTSVTQPLGLTVLSSPLYGSGGLLINSPVTPGQDEFIADSGMTTPASQHESTPLYIHTMSSSSSSAEKPSGTDWSTFCQRTGVYGHSRMKVRTFSSFLSAQTQSEGSGVMLMGMDSVCQSSEVQSVFVSHTSASLRCGQRTGPDPRCRTAAPPAGTG